MSGDGRKRRGFVKRRYERIREIEFISHCNLEPNLLSSESIVGQKLRIFMVKYNGFETRYWCIQCFMNAFTNFAAIAA